MDSIILGDDYFSSCTFVQASQKAKTARTAAKARVMAPMIDAPPRVLLKVISKSANLAWSCLGVAASYSSALTFLEESLTRVMVTQRFLVMPLQVLHWSSGILRVLDWVAWLM